MFWRRVALWMLNSLEGHRSVRCFWSVLAALSALSGTMQALAQPSPEGDGGASADERPAVVRVSRRHSVTDDRVALLAQLGLGAPSGALGVELDIAPIRYAALNLGVGVTPNGTQFAGTVRLRIPVSERLLIGVGTGISFGPHVDGGMDCWCGSDETTSAQVYERAYWHNIELAVDLYSKRGRGMAQFAIGYGHLLNPADYSCRPPAQNAASSQCGSTDDWWPFLSAAYGFDL
jgi:hypothetical protein